MGRRAESIVEYFALLCIIVGALVAMQFYFKRAMQGKVRQYSEQVAEGFLYSPGATASSVVITTKINESMESKQKKEIGNDTTERTRSTNYANDTIRTVKRDDSIVSLKDEPRRF